MRLQRILVPVDFSAQSEQAGIIAVQLANRHGAEVTLLHMDPFPGAAVVAVEPVYIPPDLFNGLRSDYNRRVDRELERLAEELAAHRAAEVKLTTERRTNSVHEGIVDFAAEWDADLVVMGSSGLSGAARLLLGSVADKVSRTAPCPVLITRADDPEQRPPRPFQNILVGIDYSPFSGPVARLATSVAESGARVELVHVWAPPYISVLDTHLGGVQSTAWTEAIEAARAGEAERLEALRSELDLMGADLFVAAGNVPSALLERAGEVGADLLVLGAHGRRDLGERLLGTTADRVLRHAEISVLVMPEAALARWSL